MYQNRSQGSTPCCFQFMLNASFVGYRKITDICGPKSNHSLFILGDNKWITKPSKEVEHMTFSW